MRRRATSTIRRSRPVAERMAVVATGGYGRGLMAPNPTSIFSLSFPTSRPPGASRSRGHSYCLWGHGAEVGHATRSVDESIRQARGDMTIRTAILETRFSHGDQPLYDELVTRFDKEVVQATPPNSSPPSLPNARSGIAAPVSRAIWSSPTSRTAKAAFAT